MSAERGSAGGGARTFRIRNPRDFFSGLVLVALALVALWAASDLPGHRGLAFGPGTAPRLFAGLLAAVGAVIALVGLFVEGPRVERYAIRGPLLITASILVFAATIKPSGLVIATFVTILVAGTASAETRWRELFVWALALTGFCTLLFFYMLGLPLPLWPQI
jgi:putative tricarboxylic transport membrane protein